jgi:MoaA/NifB/PqqE/SkfB family radical SAM enzyme
MHNSEPQGSRPPGRRSASLLTGVSGKLGALSDNLRGKWSKDQMQYLFMDISGACNLDCPMCTLKEHSPHKGLMSLESFKRLEPTIARVKHLSLQCAAEPLLNKQVAEMIRFAKTVNKACQVGFVTNGTLLKQQVIGELLAAGVNEMHVSVDGATAATFEKLRKGAKFAEVTANIKELLAQRKAVPNQLREVGLVTVASKLNLEELPAILDLAKELGVDSLLLNGLLACSADMDGEVLYARSPEEVNPRHRAVFEELKQRAERYRMRLVLPSLHMKDTGRCGLALGVVSWNGDVSPCYETTYGRPYYNFGEKHRFEHISFGNTNETDLQSIWHGKAFRKFRQDVRAGRLPESCLKCPLKAGVICSL